MDESILAQPMQTREQAANQPGWCQQGNCHHPLLSRVLTLGLEDSQRNKVLRVASFTTQFCLLVSFRSFRDCVSHFLYLKDEDL